MCVLLLVQIAATVWGCLARSRRLGMLSPLQEKPVNGFANQVFKTSCHTTEISSAPKVHVHGTDRMINEYQMQKVNCVNSARGWLSRFSMAPASPDDRLPSSVSCRAPMHALFNASQCHTSRLKTAHAQPGSSASSLMPRGRRPFRRCATRVEMARRA
eukprot:364508-Chlamydomonas_euryale.AAC.3